MGYRHTGPIRLLCVAACRRGGDQFAHFRANDDLSFLRSPQAPADAWREGVRALPISGNSGSPCGCFDILQVHPLFMLISSKKLGVLASIFAFSICNQYDSSIAPNRQ
jgi:hypothetical protein